MIWISFIAVALGSSTSGLNLTPIGGGLAGVTERGSMGLPLNPAAARSETVEGAVDFGLNFYALSVELAGQASEVSDGVVPMPSMALTVPIGDFGVGAYLTVPYGGGTDLNPEGAQRFHVIETDTYLIEAGLAVAFQPVEWLRGGASFRVGKGTLNKYASMNTAALVNSSAEPSPALDIENPLFEGEQRLQMDGYGLGYGLGVSLMLPKGHEVHLSYRSPMRVPMTGDVTLQPSEMLDVTAQGRARGELQYARELELGGVVPLGQTRLLLLLGWVDWSPLANINIDVDRLRLSGDQQATQELIDGFGLNESALLDSTITIQNDLGHGSTLHGGAAIDIPVGPQWVVRPGLFYAPTTLPSSGFHASIMDFSTLDLRLAGSYTPKSWLTLGASVDHFLIFDRDIRDSNLSLNNSADSGRVLPSGNGLYRMRATRLGFTLIVRR
jgi:long-subunit fatty acid transport protein